MPGAWTIGIVLAALVLYGGAAPAQERKLPSAPSAPEPGRDHFQLKIGAGYDQGDFGTSDTTRSFYAPLTLRYLGERFDIGITAAFVWLDTESSVVFIDGEPTPSDRRRHTSSVGFGDLYFKGRYFLVDDRGPDSSMPGLAPFVKIKAPTADKDKGLGTGEWDYGLGVEWDKRFREFFLLGDLSYTVIGEPPGQHFRNRPAASAGIGRQVTPDVAAILMLDWRRAIVSGRDDSLEIVGIVQWRIARSVYVSPYVSAGLTAGSPDFGLGAELSWKFGRY